MIDEARSKRSWDSVTPNWSILMAICTSPLFILYAILGDAGRGRSAWVSGMMIALATRYFWDLRRQALFWVAIAVVVLVHVSLITLVPWPSTHLTYVALLPIGLLDLGITYGIIGCSRCSSTTRVLSRK
jgi:hypothetical protein